MGLRRVSGFCEKASACTDRSMRKSDEEPVGGRMYHSETMRGMKVPLGLEWMLSSEIEACFVAPVCYSDTSCPFSSYLGGGYHKGQIDHTSWDWIRFARSFGLDHCRITPRVIISHPP